MTFIITFIFIIIVFLFLLKLYSVKRQLRKMAKQMAEPQENFISVDFVDRDLETVALRINKIIDALQNVKAESVRREKAIKDSISMISHDMRTPLTSVIGYLQLAEKNCKETEVLQDIRIALDRAAYCNRLVNDFFELSVIDSNRYTPVMEKINICEAVCEEILAGYTDFEKKGITPTFGQADDTIFVWADKKLFARVMQNLISNGIKYSTGEMHFSIIKDERAILSIASSVSEPIDTEKIFHKFYRSDASKGSDGIGLGLYICQKFMENMNGNISAYSTDNLLTVQIELNLC